jgi:hypothetical protein
MGHFKIGKNTIVDEICLDSTPKQSGGQKRISLFYDGWGRNTHPSLVIGGHDLQEDGRAKIVNQTLDANQRRVHFTIEAVPNASGTSFIWDTSGTKDDFLSLRVGKVLNHTDMKFDLIADLGRSENPFNLWVYRRIFDAANNDLGNKTVRAEIFKDWQDRLKGQPLKQNTDPKDQRKWNCGAAIDSFNRTSFGGSHDVWGMHDYIKPMKKNGSGLLITSIEFLNDEIKAGATRMKNALEKGTATVLFVVHHDKFATDENGRIRPSNLTHYLSVVGCNEAGTEFLVLDPWPGGMRLKYRSGIFDSQGGVLSTFMGTLRLGLRWGDLDSKGEILATPQPPSGRHEYFVVKGG